MGEHLLFVRMALGISTTLLLLGIFGKATGCGDTFSTTTGTITHPAVSGSYYNNMELCVWTIMTPVPLYFYFSRFITETQYDSLFARDGSSIGAPLLEKLNGKSVNTTFVTSGDAFIQFQSDSNVVATGFVLHWKPHSAEEQCKVLGGFCVKSGDTCDGTISLIQNHCDDRCVCCVPPHMPSPLLDLLV